MTMDPNFWIFVAVLIGLVTLPLGTQGACLYQGSLFANNTVWNPDSCQDCSCFSDIVICKTTHCHNPQCDFQKGELFRIPPNKCCPECAPRTQGFCQHEGQIYGHESEWMSSQCTVCSCTNGKVECGPRHCPPLSCGREEVQYTPFGKCCPVCVRTGETCLFEGQEYQDGEEWKPTPCSKCICNNGASECYAAECHPIVCKKDEHLIIYPGKCCPQCVTNSCLVSKKEYKHGEQWKKNACTTCICDGGEARCHTQTCPASTCERGQNKVKRAGQCCEECVSSKGNCLYEGTIRYHGEMWNGTGCEFCMCERGQVMCQKAECAKVECVWGEELMYLPGKCCPECLSMSSFCVYKEQSKEGPQSDLRGEKHLANLEKWREGVCRECECRDSQALCFQRSCPSCPVGTLAVAVEGECCPQCRPVQCHSDCLTCSHSPDHCESCRDSLLLLQNGRCVQACEPGFHENGRVCKACQETCAACKNEFECTLCGKGRLMKYGKCVTACGDGFYQNQRHCAACHESCSSCTGPAERDCLSCEDPSHMLKAGTCVASCGQGFYVNSGNCYACDQSCQTCNPDNPKCLSCPSGRVLHHGKCVSHCPDGFYRDSADRCTACHSSCAACAGPSATQCSLCPSSLVLHQGQCIPSCGEGFYPQQGVCKACHQICRSCVGPKHSDCTRCLKPEEVLHSHRKENGLPQGVCVSQCKPQLYRDTHNICKECHATCMTCTGKSAQNCTACAPPAVLYEGTCLQQCPERLYSQDNACNTCHPSCKECSGPSDADCTSCHPHATLLNGYCRTSCPQGQYLNAVGYCVDCHSQCQRCVADQQNKGNVCLWCKDPRGLLLGEECVPECPSGYYNDRGACKRCPSSCKTCSGGGYLDCTSCEAGLVLSHSGLCSSHCYSGYYSDENRVCQACNRNCLTCESAGSCTSCRDPHKVLLFGECQYESCAQQYYLDFTSRTCKECDWSCNACKGPLSTDCLQCMDRYVLQEGACMEQCSVGFYQEGDRCQRCDENCQVCDGLNQCRLCEQPYAVLRGQCVRECGKQHFMDQSLRKCTTCSSGCLECESAQQCKSCNKNSFLRNGRCTSDCGQGFYGNTKTRMCEANTQAPVLHVNGTLIVKIGGTKPLDFSFMSAHDPDSSAENLMFYLVQLPDNGRLVKMVKGKEVRLNRDDTFTFRDLREQAVRFIHAKEKSKSGQFILKVSDQQLFSQPKPIHVQAVSLQAPYVLTNEALLVNKGEAVTISSLLLKIEDDDNLQDILVMVLDPPKHGRLVRLHGDVAVQQFRPDDLERGQLQYVHDGTDSQQDLVLLQMNDGHSFQNILLKITINQKHDKGPHLLSNSLALVPEGGMLQITSRYLKAEERGSSDSEIIYTITSSKESLRFGDVILLVPMPADSPADSWQRLPDGRAATATTSFTQQDVNDGIVWYRHSGSGAPSDTFQFQVSTGGKPQQALSDIHTFRIGVMPQTPGFPQLSPGTTLQITALEDRITVIKPAALSFVDTETPSEKLVYNVTKPLAQGQGAIEHQDRPYTPVQFFTQAEINQGQILYRPPMAPSHLRELYLYSFTVSDGEHTTPEMEFTIHLLSNHQQSPVFQISDPSIEVSQGGRVPVGQQLAVSDADTAPEDLIFELVEAPRHGSLMKSDYGFQTQMRSGDTFMFDDIAQNTLQYLHDGETTEEDSMEFSVTDGITTATTQVRVLVSVTGNGGPKLASGSLLSIEVSEKSTTVIGRSHIAYVDNNSPDDKIRIQLISLPMYGMLTMTESSQIHELSEFSSFTMEDINRQRISYTTSFETGSQPVTDIFHFVVYDADNNHLDNQMCTITIKSIQQQPPVATVNSGITVEEGGRVLLSSRNILATDPDTSKKDLLIRLITPPKYGYIENSNRDGRAGAAVTVTPDVVFSLEDIISNNIYYVQSVHQTVEHYRDSFSFYITDGSSQTEAFTIDIDIRSKNDEPPKMSVSSVQVEEVSGVVIRNTSLTLLDLDTPDNELVFTVTKKPDYGKLRRRQFYSEPLENGRVLSQGSSFTYQDVLDELIVYTPDSLSIHSDEFRFSLTDGLYNENGRMEFTMNVQKRETPRLTVNRGLQLAAGSVAKITDQHLKATDIDSDEMKVRYTMTKDPTVGRLQLSKNGNLVQISIKGPVKSFMQADINKGFVEYRHEKGESGGSFAFEFDLADLEGNKLIDQSFYISILEDRLPPSVIVNKGLVLDENTVKKITTLQLSATDQDSEPGDLVYRITKHTQLGRLEHAASPGSRISTFTQADLASRSIQYVHTSEEEKHSDDFTFVVSDGANEVAQTFYITIRPVDDSLPLVQNPGMRVQEGVRKTITEFELKATDADTEAESVTFTIVQVPRHGIIERTNNGQHYRQTNSFTMDDIYQNRISYNHDGSNSLKDRFTFTVSDGTNQFFVVEEGEKEIVTAAPQRFKIDILPVDDGTPRIVTNLGLQWLEYMEGKATNLITKKELLTMDPDTEDKQLVYEITATPKHGYLESKLRPGAPITTFTQADINLGLIRYVLNEERIQETMDTFKFLVKDSKPNVVNDNVFHIQWSLISFQYTSFNVSEKAGTVSVTVKRSGNLNQYAIVLCRTEQGTATSTSSIGSKPGQQDYVEYAGQVQFDEREDTKACTIAINDDQVFENIESFNVELSMPAYALLGKITRAKVNINDTEDEPTLQFDKKAYHVNESAGFFFAPIERKGDTSSTVSALCYTVSKSAQGSSLHALESGSDFKSRGMSSENRVVFGPGVSMSTCDVKLIDDSEYEGEEEFEIALADASDNARLGDVATAKVVIDGPNDASTVFLGNASFTFSEDAGTIEIPVLRHGSDLSTVTSVWCATRPSDPTSATPGVDYIPSSKKVEFRPGKTEEVCSLTILDDTQNPTIEGLESFVVFLSSAHGAELTKPFQATVIITDTFQDVPSMQFGKDVYSVKENEGVLSIPVIRTGDLTFESSVRCYTRMQSAMVMDDFEERRNSDDSRITFLKGEKVKNCTVLINDDSVFEPEEHFQVYLSNPLGNHWSGARVGKNEVATVTITNDEDAPTIEFEEPTYQVREPPGPDGIAILNIKVIRKGDQNRTSKVRCSTRDGSAQSGVDYNPKSRVLKFSPGIDHILFNVEILSNEDREWHESFSLVLGPDDPVEAVLGEITTATVTILDQEAAGSLILPALPIVVSLSDYDHVQEVTKEGSKKTPSPGYPLVCVTPCDPHYPKYSVMKERCDEAGINQSSIRFGWEVAAPTDISGARSPFETVTDNTPYTSVNHMVLDSVYFSRRFHVRCVAKAVDNTGHVGTPLRSNIVTIGTEGSICHTPVVAGTARGYQAQSFIATLKYLDVKHKEHPNRIHISVQIPHQDGMLPLISTMPLHNLNFLLSESIYRHQHICSNLVTLRDLEGISETGFLDDVFYDSISLGPGFDRPYQFNPSVREPKTIQLYKHLNLKSCIWTFDAYYDMTELIDVCGGSVTADFQVRDSAQSFLTVQVPLYVSYIYVTAPRGWASLEHHTEMEFSFFYDTVLWRTGIQTDSVLSARLQIIRIYIREDGRLVIEFKTHAKFRGQFVMEHHTLPGQKSHLMPPDHLGGIEFDLQLLWSAHSFDSPYQLWRATSSYSRKDYSGEYSVVLIPCTVQPTQPWIDPGDKPLACTAHAPEKFLVPIAFQQTNRPVPVVYSLNTEFQLCNNEKIFMMDPATAEMSMTEMDYKGAFSMGQTLYGRVLWNPEQNLNSAYKLQLEKVYLCTGKDGYVPFFDPTGTLYNEGPQYGCIQPNKHLKHRFLILDRNQPEVCDRYFHDVPFDANFASDLTDLHSMTEMPGVDGFTMKVDALYKVEAGHQWYLQVIYVIGPESISGPRIQRSLTYQLKRSRRDLVDKSGQLTLDESLIYDNEGDQVKNGTNMKPLSLEVEAAASASQTGSSIGGVVAAVTVLFLIFLASCFLFKKCRRQGKKKMPAKNLAEEYPLNTKVEVCLRNVDRLEKNLNSKHCIARNVNILNKNEACKVKGVKVKQVNLEVKVHNNLHDGTEV
ncbi:extracellular matrix organizing protein FRAS1-like isoform X2 [Polyodon spathula]|uniref:extracellular matrix organizing protein FRAS1-like isoform X2 n=1 Tax=Polyodon spathula TaxID=7913 RepID=UPI001B7EF3EE|nr:extracellular matrix organizing protein FRAS1-like isoform X2 [Polyodon spathula]